MPRVHTVLKNRKQQHCRKCGKTIEVNEGYRHWSFRYGGKVTRCLECPSPRASELTQSGYLSRIYGCSENIEDGIGFEGEHTLDNFETYRDNIKSLIEDQVSTMEEVVDEYEDALSEWEHGNSMIEEKKEAAEQYRDELEQAANDIEGVDPDIDDEMTDEEKQEAIERAVGEVDEYAQSAEFYG